MWGLPVNPLLRVEKHPMRPSGDIQVFSPEEIWALVRAAACEQDGAVFLTAAFTGLRMGELLALRWRDVDFAGSTIRVRSSLAGAALTTPKSGKVRAVPMAPDVASALAQLGRRENWVCEDDLVFAGEAGGYLDGSALRRRYKEALARASLRPLRFHDLRHTFGTRMIAKTDIRRVQEWTGHADIQTTMRYLHYAPRSEDAQLVAEAFRLSVPPEGEQGPRRSKKSRDVPRIPAGSVTAIAVIPGISCFRLRRGGSPGNVLAGRLQHFECVQANTRCTAAHEGRRAFGLGRDGGCGRLGELWEAVALMAADSAEFVDGEACSRCGSLETVAFRRFVMPRLVRGGRRAWMGRDRRSRR